MIFNKLFIIKSALIIFLQISSINLVQGNKNTSSVLDKDANDSLHSQFKCTINGNSKLSQYKAIMMLAARIKEENSKLLLCKDNGNAEPAVEIVNSTKLANLLISDPNVTKATEGNCVIVLFYSPSCPFSCAAAPHYNYLGRVMKGIRVVAIDAMTHHMYNAQYGIAGVPNLVIFHNGRLVGRYNETEINVKRVFGFLSKIIKLNGTPTTPSISEDFIGPLSNTPVHQTDYYLGLAWVFIVFSMFYLFTSSQYWLRLIESIQNIWTESAAQHEHAG